MAVQRPVLSFALAWFLLAGPFLTGEAAEPRCKRQQVSEQKPAFYWQEAYLPLAVILGGCCGLVWWVLLIVYDVSQKGGQKGLPQISGRVELEEQTTTALDHLEEWTEAGIKWDCQGASKWNVSSQLECGPCPPCPPKEPCRTMFWNYLEQELERILNAVRCHRTTRQCLVPEERMDCLEWTNTLDVDRLNHLIGDWQNLLAQIQQPLLTVQGQSSPAVHSQQPLPKKGQSSLAKDQQQQPLPQEEHGSPSRQGQSSPATEKEESPYTTRSRSKTKPRTALSSRNRGHSPSSNQTCSSCRNQCKSCCRGPCSKRK